MRKINVLICDDQPEIVRETEELLLRYEEQYGRAMRILGVTDYEEAKDFAADLLFLDIEMQELNGFELAAKIQETAPDILIIFVSAYESYVYKSFEFRPFRFIPKTNRA